MELRGSAQERERLLQECALLPRREGASERERERERDRLKSICDMCAFWGHEIGIHVTTPGSMTSTWYFRLLVQEFSALRCLQLFTCFDLTVFELIAFIIFRRSATQAHSHAHRALLPGN